MIATIDEELIHIEGDWQQFAEWGRTFANGSHKQLRHLAEFRWSQDLDALAEDLDAVLAESNPTPEVLEFAEKLLTEIDEREGAEVLAITDGPERAVVVETFREQRHELEWCLEI